MQFDFSTTRLTLVDYAAGFAVRSALRYYLRRPAKPFVAMLQPPDEEDVLFYEDAVGRLLDERVKEHDTGKRLSAVWCLSAFNVSRKLALSALRDVRRGVILKTDADEVPDFFEMIIDFEARIEPPTPAHFMAAARITGLKGMTRDTATAIAAHSLTDVGLALGKGRAPSEVVERLRNHRKKNGSKERGSTSFKAAEPTLHELAGYGEAKTWGVHLARDLAAWKAGALTWADVDRGVLLSGPPGTGKTLFARALAETCAVPLVLGSAGRWQSKGHLGDMLKAMRKFFAEAAEKAPCIAFIDEIDSVGNRDGGRDSHQDDYMRQVINALLECLDPSEGRAGVVVVAATNKPGVIDRALLRPGRLEKIINVQLPDAAARSDILEGYIGYALGFSDFATIVEDTDGWSGADLEQLVRDAKRKCRLRGGAALSASDLEAALPPRLTLTEEQRFRIAVHETGHALLGLLTVPDDLVRVRVHASVLLGRASLNLGSTSFKKDLPFLPTEEDFRKRLMVWLGGMAAEALIFGAYSSASGGEKSSDIGQATRIADQMERELGFGENLLFSGKEEASSATTMRNDQITAGVQRRLAQALADATELLTPRREAVMRIARALTEKLELSADEVRCLVAEEQTELASDFVSCTLSSGGDDGQQV